MLFDVVTTLCNIASLVSIPKSQIHVKYGCIVPFFDSSKYFLSLGLERKMREQESKQYFMHPNTPVFFFSHCEQWVSDFDNFHLPFHLHSRSIFCNIHVNLRNQSGSK